MTRDLYERYGRQIYAYCLHQLGNREEAEDAVQTTFMNAFRGLERGVVPELESAWLYKIANNVILTRRRSSFRRRRVETPGDLDALQDLLPAPQRDRDELLRLQEALRELPEQQRKALLLREWQGLSYREIAEQLELSQSAVETLLFRARRTLAARLTEPADEPRRGLARLRSGLDLSSLLAAAKALLSGGAAVKVAVTAAAVATTAVTADREIVRHHVRPEPKAPVAATVAPKPHPRPAAAVVPHPRTVAAPPAVADVVHRAAPRRLVRAHHVVSVPVVAAPATPVPTTATTTTEVTPVVTPDPAPVATTTVAAAPPPPAPVVAAPAQERGRSEDAPGQQKAAGTPAASVAKEHAKESNGRANGHADAVAAPAPAPAVTTTAAPEDAPPPAATDEPAPAPVPQAQPDSHGHGQGRGHDGG